MTEKHHDWTPEQRAFIDAVADGSSSLDIRAVAGSGKTTTMVAAAGAADASHAYRNALACAFNKQIAVTLGQRMPYGVECKTTHSLGLAALRRNIGTAPRVEKWKSSTYLKKQFASVWDEPDFAESRSILRKLMSLAKMNMLDPHNAITEDVLVELMIMHGMDVPEGEEQSWAFLVSQALQMSNSDFTDIDFDDMIYLPLLHDMPFQSQYDMVFVDEAQDLAEIQHSLIRAVATDRVISVGDPYQAIYGWRGAVSNSMDTLAATWGAASLELGFSFRCGSAIIEEAQLLVPHIKSPANQHVGEVSRTNCLEISDLREAHAVLCRNNKPLVDVAFWCFQRNIPCYVAGSDIGFNLMALVNSLGIKNPKDLEVKIRKWRDNRVAYLACRGAFFAADSAKDRANTLLTINARLLKDKPSASFTDLKRFISEIFKDSGKGVPLYTIHKAKGLEFENVVFYGADLLPSPYAHTSEQLQQEQNLRYVAVTRAINKLTICNVSALRTEDEELEDHEND